MKLYYSTGTSSTVSHIGLEESGLSYQGVEVSWKRGVCVEELDALNPLGTVPALLTDEGRVLTQNAAILEYIADLVPERKLLAAPGTWERAETMSWVSFAGADLQRAYGPLFASGQMTSSEAAQAELEKFAMGRVQVYLQHLDRSLSGKEFIMGKSFTIADIYLFVSAGWCKWFDFPIAEYANLGAYLDRIYQRPAVQKVLSVEDLLEA